MGTWQSAVNVNCCSSKKDDELSDDERTEGETQQAAEAVCVAQPVRWDSGIGIDFAPATLQRSVSNATTIPCHFNK